MKHLTKSQCKTVVNNLCKQIKDYLGHKIAIIGLSGGIDSTVAAALCVRALGTARVFGVLLPHTNIPGNTSFETGMLVHKWLELNSRLIEINKTSQLIQKEFKDCTGHNASKLAIGNTESRIRMVYLYLFANNMNGLVIGTSNKTELKIGYCTKGGDGLIDIEPIGDLYKFEVYDIARYLKVPKIIINKVPSADLYAGQTDESEIGYTYEDIDRMLIGEIPMTDLLKQRIQNNKHKMCMPPVFLGGNSCE